MATSAEHLQRRLVVIGGVPVDNLTTLEALDRIGSFIETRQPHQIATANVDFIVKAQDDPELMRILQKADMVTADGMPLVWGSALLGAPLKERVAGSDLVPLLAERGARQGWRFFFIGAAPGVAARAADILSARHPGLQVVGVISPPKTTVAEMPVEIIHQIRSARPDILLVAFGNPKQEKWIHMHLRSLNVPVAMGVGGSLDFIAGEQRRAPPWMQSTGTEWVYRLLQDPKRMWRRYSLGFQRFGFILSQQWWRQARGIDFPQKGTVPDGSEPSFQLVEEGRSGVMKIRLPVGCSLRADLCESLLIKLQSLHQSGRLLGYRPRYILSLQNVNHIDPAGLGTLVQITRHARAAGGDLLLEGVNSSARKTLSELHLDQFLTLENPPPAVEGDYRVKSFGLTNDSREHHREEYSNERDS